MNAHIYIIYTEFLKVFNQFNRITLIKKLDLFGFSSCLLNWFQLFLSECYQIVNYLKFSPKHFYISLGIPQGITCQLYS